MRLLSTLMMVALLGGGGYYAGSQGSSLDKLPQQAANWVSDILPGDSNAKDAPRKRREQQRDAKTDAEHSAVVNAANQPNLRTPLRKAVNRIPVKGRAPTTGYSREQFGSGWRYANGCDTRNDILRRDLRRKQFESGSTCVIVSGVLRDPYGGKRIFFTRGVETSTAVQIDHRVALSDAWQKGAQLWSPAKRERFANDPLNLVAADGPLNMQKSDGDAATWLPPNKTYRCAYVAYQTAVKAKYGLWMTASEKAAVRNILKTCPKQALPSS